MSFKISPTYLLPYILICSLLIFSCFNSSNNNTLEEVNEYNSSSSIEPLTSSSSIEPLTSSSSMENFASSSDVYSSNEISSSQYQSSSVNEEVLQVAAPVFSVSSGKYFSSQVVQISSTTENAIIFYTTDGSIPTTSSALYSDALDISVSVTLKALATKSGLQNSDVVSSEYTIVNTGTFLDSRDNNEYAWVEIGSQTWMAENLNYETATGSYCYSNYSFNCDKYGRLYTWRTAMDSLSSSNSNPSNIQGVCPENWHLPSDEEWEELALFISGDLGLADKSGDYWENIGEKLKADNAWDSYPGIDTDDAFGFKAYPGGYYGTSKAFYDEGKYAYWWSSTEVDFSNALLRRLGYKSDSFYKNPHLKDGAFSVRCLKDY